MTSAEELYAVAKSSLPGWFFETKEAAHLLAAAELLAVALDHAKARVASTYLTRSTDEWAEEHARDRGTRRQAAETTEQLVERLRFAEDAVTPEALVDAANRILLAAGIATSAAISELRIDRAFFGIYTSTGRSKTYLSRGYRMGSNGPPGNKIIVILPYGTNAATAAAVAEAMRLRKAGGVGVIIEVRGVP